MSSETLHELRKLVFGVFFVMALWAAQQPAHADKVGCDALYVPGLTDSQIIDLKKQCVDSMNKVTSTPVSASDIAEYADLGKKYGVALSEVAKSIGTTVNDLAQTPVGKFMLVMVAYKVMGHDLIGIFGGMVWFVVMLPLWVYFFHRLVLSKNNRPYVDYIERNATSGVDKVIRREYGRKTYTEGDAAFAIFLMIALLLICGAGFMMIF